MSILVRQDKNEPYGLAEYIQTARENPFEAAKEIGACILIFLLMFGALYLKEILRWIEGVL